MPKNQSFNAKMYFITNFHTTVFSFMQISILLITTQHKIGGGSKRDRESSCTVLKKNHFKKVYGL